MIYIYGLLEGPVKDQIHPFIGDDLTFQFANANAMLSLLTSLYDDPDRPSSAASAFGNLHQRNRFYAQIYPFNERFRVYGRSVQDRPTFRQSFR